MASRDDRIKVINCGGTIAMGGAKPYKSIRKVAELLADVKRPTGMDIALEDFEHRPDSTNFTHAQRIELFEKLAGEYDDYDAVILLHGTDSLARTGGAANMVFKQTMQKPATIIGAQFTKDEAGSEVRLQIENSLRFTRVALDEGIVGFHNCCIGDVWRCARLTKKNESAYDSFHEPGCDPVAHTYSNVVLRGGFFLRDEKLFRRGPKLESDYVRFVNTYDAHADAPPFPLLDLIRSQRKVDGVILRCEGAGNIPSIEWEDETDKNSYSWIDAIRLATESGVVVGVLSPFEDGVVDLTRYELGAQAAEAGAISMSSLTQPTGDFKLRQAVARFGSNRTQCEEYLCHDFMRELLPRQFVVESANHA